MVDDVVVGAGLVGAVVVLTRDETAPVVHPPRSRAHNTKVAVVRTGPR